jgi:ubiquitin-protein ligase
MIESYPTVYDAWSPALSVSSVVLSILSMLSSCTEKVIICLLQKQAHIF